MCLSESCALGWTAGRAYTSPDGRRSPLDRAGAVGTVSYVTRPWLPVGRIAGAFALASGLASVAYLLIPENPEWAITAWNLLIIPTALYLGARVASRRSVAAAASTAAGIIASLLWAFAYQSPTLEPWWIGLAAAWWLGLGWLLAPERRALGRFTLLLGVAAAMDFLVTALNAPWPIYALGAFKLPLTLVWTVWVGLSLLRRPLVSHRNGGDLDLTPWSGATALVGGLLWLVSLVTGPLRADSHSGRAARFAFGVALLGLVMVGVGAVLQTSIVDPNLDFGHPAVQGGWILYIGGLVPVLSVGMLGLGPTSSREMPRLRSIILIIWLLTPLPVVASFLSGVSQGAAPGCRSRSTACRSRPRVGRAGFRGPVRAARPRR